MSFFAIEPRQLYSPSKNITSLGPGSYQVQKNQQKIHPPAYAPFGSLEKKKVNTKTNVTLGPGQYEVRTTICKPSISKYQNSNCIIIKINDEGWSQFKSKTHRFQHLTSQSLKNPGPGEYELQRQRPHSQNKLLHKSSIGQKIKEINLKNYIERRKPSLFSDPIQCPTQETKKKSIPKGLSWSLNKKQRFDPLEKQAFHEQHKQQFIDKIKDEKKKARSKSQSAVFASKSLKSQFEADIYQTSNPFKVELRKMIKYKDDRPGPGSYNYEEAERKKKMKFRRHQFFGSTVQRFRTQQNTDANIGPGYYSPKHQSENNSPTKNRILQNTEINLNRHSYIPQINNPGPGSYKVDKVKKHRTSCKWVFGSKQPRFSEESTIEQNQQQIDEYKLLKQLRKQKQFQYRKQFLNSGNQANFASTTKRFQQTHTQSTNIPVGHYDTTQSDIATKIKKSTKHQRDLNKTNHQVQSVPFMSSVDRFATQNQDSDDNGHHDCWCLVKSVEKQVYQHQSSTFSSKQKRIIVFEDKQRKYTPAVGTYTQESKFVKSSFNSRFLKANENKNKKLKIWNSHKNKNATLKHSASAREEEINLLRIN